MAQTKAWLLDLDAEHFSAIGNQHMVEYIASVDFEIMPVPLAPDYSPGVMLWRNQIIPVIDLALVLNPHERKLDEMSGVMILTYQEAPGAPLQHGAIVLRGAPQNILVDEDMACPLPQSPSAWRKLAVACISSSGKVAPILNIKTLFSSSLRKLYKESQQSGPAASTETDTLMQDIEETTDPMFSEAEPYPDDASGNAGDPLTGETPAEEAGEQPANDILADTGSGPESSMPDTRPREFTIDDVAETDADAAGKLTPAFLPEVDHEEEDTKASGADPLIPSVLDLLDRAERAQERIYEETDLYGTTLEDAEELADDTDETCSDESHDSAEAQDESEINADTTSDEIAEDEVTALDPVYDSPAPQSSECENILPAPEVDAVPGPVSEENDFNAETHEEDEAVQQDETPMQFKPLGGGYRNKYGPGRRTKRGQTRRTKAWLPRWMSKESVNPNSDD